MSPRYFKATKTACLLMHMIIYMNWIGQIKLYCSWELVFSIHIIIMVFRKGCGKHYSNNEN